MAEPDFLSLLVAALGGGLAVKLFEIGHQEYSGWRTKRSDHSANIDQILEPLLRAADELVGKLRSLAEQDFLPIQSSDKSSLNDPNLASVVYLFVQFWSEVEIVRIRGLSSSVARSARGKQTQAFLTCLESRRVRLIDRISQRALGEAVQVGGRTMNYVEFVRSADSDPYMQRWLNPLQRAFDDLNGTAGRQKMLQHSVVLHALIDTLDKEHLVTRDRPATPNKLSKRSWRDLNYRVFGVYLSFVANKFKYIGPPN